MSDFFLHSFNTLSHGVIGYVALRIERSFAAAQAVVARLDEEAMRHQRPLTRAFAAECRPSIGTKNACLALPFRLK